MIGKQKSQYSLLDSVFNRRTKKSGTATLLKKIDTFVDWRHLDSLYETMYKDSRKSLPSIPIITALKCLFLQCLYNLSDPALDDALIDRLSFQRFAEITFDSDIPDYSSIC